jgi:hypothetical protein
VVVDFAVENNDQIAAIRKHRLVSALEIDNLQPDRTQRHRFALEDSLLIRTAMANALDGPQQHAGKARITAVGEPRYPTHGFGTPLEVQVIENGNIAAASNRSIIAGNCSMH